MTLKKVFLIFLLFFIALTLRVYGLNWDQDQHLHPDERFLTMVLTTLKLPQSINQYLDTPTSPLNPFNYPDYQFFVYGTFPLFLTKFIGVLIAWSDYDHIALLGRFLSALFDAFNIIPLYFLSRLLFKKSSPRLHFLPSFLYAFTVLPLQLSHFFAVDTFLNFFLLTSFTFLAYFLDSRRRIYVLMASLMFALALACKMSAILFFPIIALTFALYLLKTKNFISLSLVSLCCLLIAFLTFRFFQPYSFTGLITPNPLFIASLKTLSELSKPDIYFPPAVQWISKTKILFPLQNLVFWGLGLPLSLSFLAVIKFRLQKSLLVLLMLLWIFVTFFYQGTQFAHAMRYFLPAYPFLIILSAYFLDKFPRYLALPLIALHLLWGLAFLNIYSHPHSRISASSWIFQNIPSSATLSAENWDDALPLSIPGFAPSTYQYQSLSPFDPESQEKWTTIYTGLEKIDFLSMSSNRLWASIPKVPHIYPQTSKFYADLFDGRLAFRRIFTQTSYPGFPLPWLKKCIYIGSTDYPYRYQSNHFFQIAPNCSNPGVYFRDDTADETFTVYDHPQILVFEKKDGPN